MGSPDIAATAQSMRSEGRKVSHRQSMLQPRPVSAAYTASFCRGRVCTMHPAAVHTPRGTSCPSISFKVLGHVLQRKARPGRGPPTERSPGPPASPMSPGGKPGRPTYSLNDNAVHYDGGAGAGNGAGHRNGLGVRRSSAPNDGDGGETFARRSGGSMGDFERRGGGSEVADAAHYAALEEKVGTVQMQARQRHTSCTR